MKKKWIAEGIYMIAGLFFVAICITGRTENKPVRDFPGATVTETPFPNTTQDVIPEIKSTPEVQPTAEIKSTPKVQPTAEIQPTPEVQPTPMGQASVITKEPEVTPSPAPTPTQSPSEVGKMPGAIEMKNENYEQYENEKDAWWFSRNEEHLPSRGGESFSIAPYSAYYLNKDVTDEDKVMYLTFDCGYENGFTPAILDTLKEKNVKAMFFVTKGFVANNPDYVKRMKEEGHLVGNHTVRHLSSPSLTPEELETELTEVAKAMEELTGYRMDPFFRPPMGEYSERTLKATQDLGYASVFWSIAYYDYNANDQPGKDYVVNHFATYHHNGSIVLMHNTSASNMQALGEVIDLLRQEGYRLGELTEFISVAQ